MAGPSPHVPPSSLVPHFVPPLSSSSDPDLDRPSNSIQEPSLDLLPPPINTTVLPPPGLVSSGTLQASAPPQPLLSDPSIPDPPFTSSGDPLSGVHQNLLTSTFSQHHQPIPPPPPQQPVPPDPFPPLPQAQPSAATPKNPHSIPSSSNSRPHRVSFSGVQASAPGPIQRSYAQATSFVKGPGFVRAHARDVESFAQLPRTGVNIICGSKEGMPSFSFVNSDMPKVEALYSQALVMKFHGGRPSLEASHKEILSWGMEAPFSIGPLTSRAFLLRFQSNSDLLKVLSRPSSMLITFSYKVFRWHNLCHLNEDSFIAPVWISLPKLPLQCFIPEFLEAVANKIGRFLCFDKATATLARPSAARLCVELDLRKPPPPFIWIGLFDGFKQAIIYDKLPKFCNNCHTIGHAAVECLKHCTEAPSAQQEERAVSSLTRTQNVRQNAYESSFSFQKQRSSKKSFTSKPNLPIIPTHTPAKSHISNHGQQPPSIAEQAALHHVRQQPSSSTNPPQTVAQPITPIKSAIPPLHKEKLKRKSVSFVEPVQQQPPVEADKEFWEAAHQQVSFIEQEQVSEHMNPSTSVTVQEQEISIHTTNKFNSLSDHISEESESGSSIAADSQPGSPLSAFQDAQNPAEAFQPGTYDSEGEEPATEASPIQGHNSDDFIPQPPQSSKRNKRHPDQPLIVQLRVRRDPNSTSQC